MAKLIGIIGTGRGRLGNAVLCKGDNGATFARTYQPQVRNPRTYAQRLQRAKMNLAGQFAKLVETEFLSAMGMGNGRNNRSAFVSNILKKAIASTDVSDSSKYNAVIAGEDVKFSNGAENLRTSVTTTLNASNVTLVATSAIPVDFAETYGERVVVAGLNENSGFDFVQVADMKITAASGSTQNMVVGLPVVMEAGKKVMVWRMPFVLGSTVSSLVGDDPSITGDNITAVLKAHSNSTDISWGQTSFVGTFTYVAPAGSE